MHSHPDVFCNTGLRHTLLLFKKMDNISELPEMIRVNYLADSFCTGHLINIIKIRDWILIASHYANCN